MALRIGNIARGDDFFGRVREMEDLWEYLEGNHITFTGARRLGKSSILARLVEQAAEKGWTARLIDVEGIDTAEAFIKILDREFPRSGLKDQTKGLSGKAAKALQRVKKINLPVVGGGIDIETLPETRWGKSAQVLQKRLGPAPVLLLIDEFSVFLSKLIARDLREAELLLGWLRAWRQNGESNCRFVFSGSVGINALLERHQLSTWLNDCYEYELGPFKTGAAIDMLTALAKREGWALDEGLVEVICEKSGWLSPFYLNLLLDESIKAARDRMLENHDGQKQELIRSDVEDAYDRLLTLRSRFIHWYQRLRRDLDDGRYYFTLDILSHVANAKAPMTKRQLMARLAKSEPDERVRGERLSEGLAYLRENGYLGEDREGKVSFLSFLLRDYWRRNHAE